jgi:PKD repeat protein
LERPKHGQRRQTQAPPGPPVAGFGCSRADPSTLDTVRFYDYSYDPGHRGIGRRTWEFGDGVNGTGRTPEHRFAADGDYTVTLTVATPDGRWSSASSSLVVRTRDVSISFLDVPTACRVGETIEAVVGVVSAGRDETVEVLLLRRTPDQGSFEQVDRVTTVAKPVGVAEPTLVTLAVTFGAGGVAELKAVVAILGGRDASPDDNTALASIRVRG